MWSREIYIAEVKKEGRTELWPHFSLLYILIDIYASCWGDQRRRWSGLGQMGVGSAFLTGCDIL